MSEIPETLDRATLEALRDLLEGRSDQLFQTLIRSYLETTNGDFEGLRRSLSGNDREEARRLLERLRSSSELIGAIRVSELCRAIENAISLGRPRDLRPIVARLGEELERAQSALAELPAEG